MAAYEYLGKVIMNNGVAVNGEMIAYRAIIEVVNTRNGWLFQRTKFVLINQFYSWHIPKGKKSLLTMSKREWEKFMEFIVDIMLAFLSIPKFISFSIIELNPMRGLRYFFFHGSKKLHKNKFKVKGGNWLIWERMRRRQQQQPKGANKYQTNGTLNIFLSLPR